MPIAANVRLTPGSVDKLRQLLSRDRRTVPLKRHRIRVLKDVTKGAKAGITKDTGRLRKSLRWKVTETGGRVWSDETYSAAVDQGSKPHWPPPGALDGWARRHGIPSGFLVARKIAERGTPAQEFMQAGIDYAQARLVRSARIAAADIEAEWDKVK